jgi:threonine dehydrogenase-like Zn-dependent dehydrogenase
MTTTATMRALQLQSPGCLAEVEIPVPHPGADELLVRTLTTTICTSDLHDIDHNPFHIRLPRVPGHEAAGVVSEVGSGVTGFDHGDAIAAHPVIPCRMCANCLRGFGHLCTRMGHLGLDRDGTFAEFFCIRADRARKVPPELARSTGSLLEPVAVCLEALERGSIHEGDSLLIVGDGPFGLIMARLAGDYHPARVIVVGRHDFRLRQLEGAFVINERDTRDVAGAVRSANSEEGVDVAILAVGNPAALDLCLTSVRARGRIVVFSAVPGAVPVDLFRLHTAELELRGACNDRDLIDSAHDRLVDRGLNLDSLITHRIPFVDWARAFELARHGKDSAIKVALTFTAE